MQKKLTKLQAYNVMLNFLELFYLRNESDDIGDLLSDSEFFWGGRTTADPASWVKWKEALILTKKQDEKIRSENRLTYRQSFHVMLNYLKIYRSLWGETEDIDSLIKEVQILYKTDDENNMMWRRWFEIAGEVSVMEDPRMQKEFK